MLPMHIEEEVEPYSGTERTDSYTSVVLGLMGKPSFKVHVDRVRRVAKERGNVSVPALGYELSTSPGYVMRIAQTACQVDSELMRRPYVDRSRAWILFSKKGFEEWESKRRVDEAKRFEEIRKTREAMTSRPQSNRSSLAQAASFAS